TARGSTNRNIACSQLFNSAISAGGEGCASTRAETQPSAVFGHFAFSASSIFRSTDSIYFLPAKRTRAVKARLWPPEKWPKLGASTLFTTTLGFCQLKAFTASMRAAHRYPRNANFFSSARFRFL